MSRLPFRVYGAVKTSKNKCKKNIEQLIMTIKLLHTNLDGLLYRALILPNWPKCQSLNPHNLTNEKTITGEISFQI